MTPEERDRLVILESHQAEMLSDIKEIKADVAQMKITFARAGGVMLAFGMIAGFLGYMISLFKEKLAAMF